MVCTPVGAAEIISALIDPHVAVLRRVSRARRRVESNVEAAENISTLSEACALVF